LKCSHVFNLLDSRGAISVTERVGLIGRVRQLACEAARRYVASREEQDFPLLKVHPAPTTFKSGRAATLWIKLS
jgi:glycyl-tRNA synthetase alpha chain